MTVRKSRSASWQHIPLLLMERHGDIFTSLSRSASWQHIPLLRVVATTTGNLSSRSASWQHIPLLPWLIHSVWKMQKSQCLLATHTTPTLLAPLSGLQAQVAVPLGNTYHSYPKCNLGLLPLQSRSASWQHIPLLQKNSVANLAILKSQCLLATHTTPTGYNK